MPQHASKFKALFDKKGISADDRIRHADFSKIQDPQGALDAAVARSQGDVRSAKKQLKAVPLSKFEILKQRTKNAFKNKGSRIPADRRLDKVIGD